MFDFAGCAEQGQLGRVAECFSTRGGRLGLGQWWWMLIFHFAGCAEQGQLGRIAECFSTRGGRHGLGQWGFNVLSARFQLAPLQLPLWSLTHIVLKRDYNGVLLTQALAAWNVEQQKLFTGTFDIKWNPLEGWTAQYIASMTAVLGTSWPQWTSQIGSNELQDFWQTIDMECLKLGPEWDFAASFLTLL